MNYKLLNDIDKLNNFGEIELNERVYIFKENDKSKGKKIKELFDTDDGFIHKKTMYKVKDNE